MKKIKLPEMAAPALPAGVEFDVSPHVLSRWNPSIQAAANEGERDNTINILDSIGEDWMGEGVTARRIDAALRSIGRDADVVVNINSPGGSMFEGAAIYNLLRAHAGHVTVRILGLAGSAASVIAMAGDRIEIARNAWLMIHNGWIITFGNRNDLRERAEWLEPFDDAAADLYAYRTGIDKAEIVAMMDREAWIGGAKAVETGWADGFLAENKIHEAEGEPAAQNAVRQADLAMARGGLPRSQRRAILQHIKGGMPSAAASGTQDAAGKGTPTAAQEVRPVMVARPPTLAGILPV